AGRRDAWGRSSALEGARVVALEGQGGPGTDVTEVRRVAVATRDREVVEPLDEAPHRGLLRARQREGVAADRARDRARAGELPEAMDAERELHRLVHHGRAVHRPADVARLDRHLCAVRDERDLAALAPR